MLNASDLRHLGDALTELDRRGETFFGSKMMAMSIFCAFLYEVIQIIMSLQVVHVFYPVHGTSGVSVCHYDILTSFSFKVLHSPNGNRKITQFH